MSDTTLVESFDAKIHHSVSGGREKRYICVGIALEMIKQTSKDAHQLAVAMQSLDDYADQIHASLKKT